MRRGGGGPFHEACFSFSALARVEGHDELALVLQLLKLFAEFVADASLVELQDDQARLVGVLVEGDELDRCMVSRLSLPSWMAMAKTRTSSLLDST